MRPRTHALRTAGAPARTTAPALAALGAAALLLAACSGGGTATDASPTAGTGQTGADGGTVTVTHSLGTSEVPVEPQRVVVMDMGALDTIHTLGAGDAVVGVPQSNLPTFLTEYADVTNVGTLQEPDMEAIARLNPDLVVLGGRSAAHFEALSAAYPTVATVFGEEGLLEMLKEQADMFGAIFDEQAKAENEYQQVADLVEEIRPLGEAAGTGLVLQTSGGEVSLNGPGTRFGTIHTLLGVEPALVVAADEASAHGTAISFELIAEANPDWLFVNDRDAAIGQGTQGQAAAQVLDNPLVASTTAWTTDQVVYLDGERWYIVISGLDNAEIMLRQVGDALGA